MKATSETAVRTWYMAAYPMDDLGERVRAGITFRDVLNALYAGDDVYECIGIHDSVVRSRVFEELAVIAGVSYSDIFGLWQMA